MSLESDRMVNSRIDKADLDFEMTVVRSELEGRENSPGTLLNQASSASRDSRRTRTTGPSSAGAPTWRTCPATPSTTTTRPTTGLTTPRS